MIASAAGARAANAGVAIIELLVASAFVAVFAALTYSLATSCLLSIHTQQARSDSQDTAHTALDFLERDLRQAGYAASGEVVTRIGSATAARLEVLSDWNGDGDFDDASEIIAYAEDTTRGTLTRASGGGSPQPLADHVLPGSLRFTYYDGGGAELPPSAGGLDAAQRAAVRRTDVTFTIAVPILDARLGDLLRTTVAATIGVRNVPPT